VEGSQVVFIGEAPGEEEDKQGEYFKGKAGDLLRRLLPVLPRYTLLNTVRCRPVDADGKNRPPTVKEAELCSAWYLHNDLEQLKPQVVICLGRVAARAMKLPDVPILELRFKEWVSEMAPGAKVYVTFHPAAGLRPGKINLIKELEDDLKRILSPESHQQVPENRALTNETKHDSLDLESMVIDIETSGFLQDGEPFPFGKKAEILVLGALVNE